VNVKAKRNGKYSDAASGEHLTSIPPPRALQLVETNEDGFQISWKKPQLDKNVEIKKYKIDINHGFQINRIKHVPNRNEQTWRTSGLEPGTEYSVNISALVEVDESLQEGRCEQISIFTKLDVPMELIFITSTSSGRLDFQWLEPNGPVTHFKVQTWENTKLINEETSKTEQLHHGATRSCPHRHKNPCNIYQTSSLGLQENEEYTIKVASIFEQRGKRLVSSFAKIIGTVLSRNPTDLVVKLHGNNTASVTWNPPSVAVVRYLVKVSDLTDDHVRESQTYPIPTGQDSRYILIPMILPGRQYEIQLRALVLIDGEQVPSEALSSVVQTAPDRPRDLRVEMNYQKENTITLKWRNPDAPVRDYHIRILSDPYDARSSQVIDHFDPRYTLPKDQYGLETRKQVQVLEIEGLYPGQKYNIEVFIAFKSCRRLKFPFKVYGVIPLVDVNTGEDIKTPPAIANFSTEIDSIRDLQVTDCTSEEITLEWTPPKARITRYKISWSNDIDQPTKIFTFFDNKNQIKKYTLGKLDPSTSYTISLGKYSH
jgi:hypothetical protein